jgi:hypothetical protein
VVEELLSKLNFDNFGCGNGMMGNEAKRGMKNITIQGLGSWRSYTGLPRYFSFTGLTPLMVIPLWYIVS